MRFLQPLESLMGMLQCLVGMLMSSLVIFFAVVRRRNAVCVCGEFVEFGGSLMRVIWHSVCHPGCPAHLKTIPFFRLSNYEHSCRCHPLLIRRQKPANGPRDQAKHDSQRSLQMERATIGPLSPAACVLNERDFGPKDKLLIQQPIDRPARWLSLQRACWSLRFPLRQLWEFILLSSCFHCGVFPRRSVPPKSVLKKR